MKKSHQRWLVTTSRWWGESERTLTACQSGRASRNSSDHHQGLKRAIGHHFKRVERSIAIRQVIKETTVMTLSQIDGMAAVAGYGCPAIRIKQLKTPVRCHTETRDRAAACIARVDEPAIM